MSQDQQMRSLPEPNDHHPLQERRKWERRVKFARKWTNKRVAKEVLGMVRYALETKLPTLESYCVPRGYSTKTLYEWEHSEFVSETVKNGLGFAKQLCKDKCVDTILKGGLSSQFNPTMCIFALKNIGQWKDDPMIKIDNRIGINNNGNGSFSGEDKEFQERILATLGQRFEK